MNSDFNKDIKVSVDYSGLKCPLPVLKARRVMKDLTSGDKVQIIADDPASLLDFNHFCEVSGIELLYSICEDDKLLFILNALAAASIQSLLPSTPRGKGA